MEDLIDVQHIEIMKPKILFIVVSFQLAFSAMMFAADTESRITNSMLIGPNGNKVDGTRYGIWIRKTNSLELPTVIVEKYKNDGLEKMLKRLDHHDQCVAVYVLLNQLYPQHRMDILDQCMGLLDKEMTVGIRVPSNGKRTNVQVPWRTFSSIVKAYWTKKLAAKEL